MFYAQKANVGPNRAAERGVQGLRWSVCSTAQCWWLGILDVVTEAWIVQGELQRKWRVKRRGGTMCRKGVVVLVGGGCSKPKLGVGAEWVAAEPLAAPHN